MSFLSCRLLSISSILFLGSCCIEGIWGVMRMVKRKATLAAVLILSVVCIGGIVTAIIKSRSPDIQTFSVSEYQYYIDNFSAEKDFGVIADTKDLLKKAERVWIEKYGKRVKSQKPYQVLYDEKNGIWLVRGTLHADRMGGVAHVLVDSATGKVLAVWHDK